MASFPRHFHVHTSPSQTISPDIPDSHQPPLPPSQNLPSSSGDLIPIDLEALLDGTTDQNPWTRLSQMNPVPFTPQTTPHCERHAMILKYLGFWGFVQTNFDRNVRMEFVSQLVASYRPGSKEGYVKGRRVRVDKFELGRALNLPLVNTGLVKKGLSEEEILFVVEFVLDWMVLCDIHLVLPMKTTNWLETMKSGHLDKIDWCEFLWEMVEKELVQGEMLVDCYYAVYLQQLIKNQHPDLFSSPVDDSRIAEEMVEEMLGLTQPSEAGNVVQSVQNSIPNEAADLVGRMRDSIDKLSKDNEEKERLLQEKCATNKMLSEKIRILDDQVAQLQKPKTNELRDKDFTIYRLRRQLDLTWGVLEGYKKKLKKTNMDFAEYRERAEHPWQRWNDRH